jgi:hypothetical protein
MPSCWKSLHLPHLDLRSHRAVGVFCEIDACICPLVYTFLSMSMKILTSIGFASYVLLGNVCMMQMAGAEEMPMSHGEHAEMDMTPMSSTDCEHCPKQEEPDETPKKGMPCSGGHCISESIPQSSAAVQTPGLLAAAMPPTVVSLPTVSLELNGLPHSTAPPGIPISTKTIVLRC